MSKSAASTARKTAKPRGKPFAKGQSGNPNGRPVGSRQKLSEKFIDVLSTDFEQHGEATIKTLRKDKPDVYVRVVADLVPRDVNLKHDATEAFADVWKALFGGRGEE